MGLPVVAENLDKRQNDFYKRAFKLRKDVSKEAAKKMKNWDKPGKLHSDWIENQYGRSIDLQGNELFPDMDYTHLTPRAQGIYEISKWVGGYRKGIFKRNGTQIVPMEYDEVSWKWNTYGALMGIKGKRTPYAHVDIYTTDGILLLSLSDVPYNYEDSELLSCQYDFKRDIFVADYQDPQEPNVNVCRAFLADGTELSEPVRGKLVSYDFPNFMVYEDGTRKQFAIPQAYASNKPKLEQADREEWERMSCALFNNDKWKQLAVAAFEAGKYKEALEYFLYLYDIDCFEAGIIESASPSLMLCSYMMRCYYELGNYQAILNANDASSYAGFMLPWSYYNYAGYDDAKLNLWPKNSKEESLKLLHVCRDIYQAAGPAFAEQQQRRQQNAEMWGNIMMAVGQSLTSMSAQLSNNWSTTAGSAPVSSSAGSMTVPTSSHGSSSSSNTHDTPEKKTCPRCHGEKTVVTEHSITVAGYGLRQEKTTCQQCGKSYDKTSRSHKHETCPSCHGKGYYEVK